MLIYDALRKDHDAVKTLLNELLALPDHEEVRRDSLIQEIRDELIPHSRAEEAVFYNSIRSLDSAKDLIGHGFQEHIEAEALLRTLQLKDKMNMDWKKTAKKLKDALEHHIAEEERDIIPAAERIFTLEEGEMMGEAFARLKQEVKEEGFLTTTLELLTNMMPPRFASNMRRFNLENRAAR